MTNQGSGIGAAPLMLRVEALEGMMGKYAVHRLGGYCCFSAAPIATPDVAADADGRPMALPPLWLLESPKSG